MPDIRIKVVNAGNCLLCGRLISTEDCNSGVASIFYCKKCKDKMLRRRANECKTESEKV